MLIQIIMEDQNGYHCCDVYFNYFRIHKKVVIGGLMDKKLNNRINCRLCYILDLYNTRQSHPTTCAMTTINNYHNVAAAFRVWMAAVLYDISGATPFNHRSFNDNKFNVTLKEMDDAFRWTMHHIVADPVLLNAWNNDIHETTHDSSDPVAMFFVIYGYFKCFIKRWENDKNKVALITDMYRKVLRDYVTSGKKLEQWNNDHVTDEVILQEITKRDSYTSASILVPST